MREDAGFTLVELMVVVSVIGIISGMAALSFSRTIPEYRLSSAVRELQSTLQAARLSAVKGRQYVTVSFDPATDSFVAFTDDGANKGAIDPDETILMRSKNYQGVDFYSTSGSSIRLRFNPRGFPVGGVEDFCFKNSLNGYRGVRSSVTGNSKVIKSGDGVHWQ